MFRRLAHVKEEGSPLGVDHGHPNFLERRYWVIRRITRVKVLFLKRQFLEQHRSSS